MLDWLYRLHAADPWAPTILAVTLVTALVVAGALLTKMFNKDKE